MLLSPTLGVRSQTNSSTRILDYFRLDGKTAVVSAAGRGIGAWIATAFAEVGADVVIGARSPDQLAEVAAGIEALGGAPLSLPVTLVPGRAWLASSMPRSPRLGASTSW